MKLMIYLIKLMKYLAASGSLYQNKIVMRTHNNTWYSRQNTGYCWCFAWCYQTTDLIKNQPQADSNSIFILEIWNMLMHIHDAGSSTIKITVIFLVRFSSCNISIWRVSAIQLNIINLCRLDAIILTVSHNSSFLKSKPMWHRTSESGYI